MVLTGLIFLPLFAIPTVALLKKNFQIKVFFALVSFVHFMFALGLLTKHGYLFKGIVLSESLDLFSPLGLNYAVSLRAGGLLLAVTVNFLYVIAGSLSLGNSAKKEVVLLFLSQICFLLALTSTNILAVVLSTFAFSFTQVFWNEGSVGLKASFSKTLIAGLVLLFGVCLILSILHESVHGYSNLNIQSLSAMRTPFVKGSLYSTQFILFIFYCIGFLLIGTANLIKWINFVRNKIVIKTFLPSLGFGLSVYSCVRFMPILFPEATNQYLANPHELFTWGLIVILATFLTPLLIPLLSKATYLFLERTENV